MPEWWYADSIECQNAIEECVDNQFKIYFKKIYIYVFAITYGLVESTMIAFVRHLSVKISLKIA